LILSLLAFDPDVPLYPANPLSDLAERALEQLQRCSSLRHLLCGKI